MTVKETITVNGVKYDHTYSDAGYMIERDGVLYADAVDPKGSGREYTETDWRVEQNAAEDATSGDYLAALNEMGVDISEEENS